MPAYRWATLGCGVIGNELAQAMQALGGNLYSVGNRTHEKALSFAEKYGIAKVYDKPEDIFSDPDVDIVYILTPHNTHIRYLLPALAAGKPVLCEKSITLNSSELNKLKALADEKASILLMNPSGQMATKQTIIEAGHTSDALQYELEDMETAILTGNTTIMKLRESSDVMDIMTKLRSDWGLFYPEGIHS